MAYEENLEQSKEYIKNFCEEYFKLPVSNESIDKLKTFDFIELWEKKDTTFGYTGIPDKLSEFDPDRSNLAKNLYFIIWGDVLPKTKAEFILSKESKAIDTNGDYCGETLNTFMTLFDKTALTEMIYEDTELAIAVENFKHKYLSLGNFMLLPKKRFIEGINKKSINQYRGTYLGKDNWHDYFDIFLEQLSRCLPRNAKDANADPFLAQLVDLNSFYFDIIDTIQKFRDINFLEPYFTENGEVQINFPERYTHSEELAPEVFKKFALNYIKKASEVIDYRAERMADVIKYKFGLITALPNYDK